MNDLPVIDVPQNPVVTLAPTPLTMLAAAVQRGMDVATIQGLMDLQERWEKSEAQRAYNEAFAAFKADAVQVIKNKLVTDGPLRGKSYAELFSVVDAVTPALSRHGLSASWRITKDDKDWIEVTCSLKHVKGHSESVSMGGPPDAGGAKSAIQARASTVSYLERYTLKAVCGVAEKGDDGDGAATSTGLTDAEVAEWKKKIEATTAADKAKAVWKDAAQACRDRKDRDAAEALKKVVTDHCAFIEKAA